MDAVLPPLSQDDEAMRRVVAGDTSALAVLFDRHKGRLFGYLMHLVADRALAEDLLGETFLRVYRSRTVYRAGSGFEPWLYSIARNLAVSELRRRGCRSRAHEQLFREAAAADGDWHPEQQELRDEVRAALARLPEEQRSAVVLKEYLGLEYAEIARVLGCTEQAARARTYRARQALRELLRGWWEA